MHTQKVNIVWFYLHEIQKSAKLIYSDRSQNSGYLWGQYQLREDKGKPTRVLEMFYILVLHGGYLGTCLKFHQANSKICALYCK